MITIENIENLHTRNSLEEAVKEIILSEVDENYIDSFFEDLQQNGCISGMIGALIYYADTTKFFETHIEDINQELKDLMWEIGADSPTGLFGDKYDSEDPLCRDNTNQNLLAWFAFETVADRFCRELEEEAA
jgi:hypothetical protein